MKDFGLEFREKYGHPNIVVPMEDDLEFGAQAILNYFEDQIRQGAIFREGETVQIGWSILMLKAGAGETLETWEPEFSSMPISWIRGANTTYRHLMVQKEVCSQFGVEPDYPSLRQAAVVSSEFSSSNEFFMVREPEDASNSGWVLTSRRGADANAEFRSLFEMAIKARRIIPFLALPVGAVVKFNRDEVSAELVGKKVSSKDNDLIGMVLKSYKA
ncbi:MULTISPECIES: immunity protein Imm33 domain-containing protein [Burkholderia]|uniref:immunity protein Imm33 domain-containing protein n=1 Tax=Burkholderia TaxID=32008 RepID=UPI0011C4C533|nr:MULTISPECIES: hypothetical protein [Burkholderia]